MQTETTHFQYNDGGRAASGFKGMTGDCVTRAIAIATGKPYEEVYSAINQLAGKAMARTGVPRSIYEPYLAQLGWKWVPTMFFGQGCKIHLNREELPKGRLIVRLSKHLTAVVDGVVQDSFDCTRGGKRCVYGYFVQVH